MSERDSSTTVMTAERVPLALPVAGLGERAIALLVDFLIVVLLAIAVLFVYTFVGRGDLQRDVSAATTTMLVLAGVTVLAGLVFYDTAFELVAAGRTPGKMVAKLRVVDRHGNSPDAVTSLLRNALRLVDMIPFGYGVGVITIFFTGTRRIGDLVAGTLVISERGRGPQTSALLKSAAQNTSAEGALLNDDDVLRIIAVLRRTDGLDARLAEQQCARTVKHLDDKLGASTGPARARLAAAVLAQESGIAVRITRVDDAERALHDALARWRSAPSAQAHHQAALELDAAARHASSELLLATRRGVPQRLLESLSLALLDVERRRAPPKAPLMDRVLAVLMVEVPQAVWRERAGIMRAGVVLFGTFIMGFVLAFLDEGLSRALIGDELVALVEQGARWTDQIEAQGNFLGAALSIVFNNVAVGVRVFVLGVLGGIATVMGLAMNGLSLGATFGTAVRLDTADTLSRFIIAHGPVELSMICVAGAAGFCLGRAIIAPGPRTRIQALREEGRTGLCLLIFAVIGFVFIGFVEGFVSPGKHFPIVVNITVGIVTWLLFFLWAKRGHTLGSPTANS